MPPVQCLESGTPGDILFWQQMSLLRSPIGFPLHLLVAWDSERARS